MKYQVAVFGPGSDMYANMPSHYYRYDFDCIEEALSFLLCAMDDAGAASGEIYNEKTKQREYLYNPPRRRESPPRVRVRLSR